MSKVLIQKLHNIIYEDGEFLDLSYAGLKKFPKRIQYCRNLKRLNLSGNAITDIQLNVARNLPQCQYLDLSGNKLSNIPESFSNNLQYSLLSLNLSYNLLNVFPCGPVYMLQHLRELNLSNNGISQISAGLNRLKNLEVLLLAHNQISHVLEEVNTLSSLQVLDISFNLINTLPDNLNGIEHLQILKLSGNAFIDVPESLQDLTALRELEMSSCDLEQVNVSVLLNLPQLKRIDLSYNPKLKRIPKTLAKLDCVHEIDMSGNEYARWPATVRKMRNIKCEVKNLSNEPCTPSPQNSSEMPTIEAPSLITAVAHTKRRIDETYLPKPLEPSLPIPMESIVQSPKRLMNINVPLPPPLPEARRGRLLERQQ